MMTNKHATATPVKICCLDMPRSYRACKTQVGKYFINSFFNLHFALTYSSTVSYAVKRFRNHYWRKVCKQVYKLVVRCAVLSIVNTSGGKYTYTINKLFKNHYWRKVCMPQTNKANFASANQISLNPVKQN